jgi:Flp pilus assembly protein TadG
MCVKNFDNSLNKIVMAAFGKATQKASALKTDERGASALEFAIFAGILAFGLLNTADISIYIYKRMQVENATEMAAQAAWKACDPSKGYLPATLSCPNLTTAMTQAAQSTALGNQVTIATGSPQEGFYCLNDAGALQHIANASLNPPADCSSTGLPGQQPGDYIRVTTSFSYAPLFPGVTVAGVFPTPIMKTSMMRLN